MKILLTNNTLSERAGTECYIRDIAAGLLRRGHRPIAYSTKLGILAEELRSLGVPVVDDLRKISITPDVIHAQHHMEAMSALLYFSNVPALYVCHGWRPWVERPPRFPRILRYGAIDEATYDRLSIENSIPAERISLILNSVDLKRIRQRETLPEKAKRALIFSNYVTSNSNYYQAINKACKALDLELDVIGSGINYSIENPGDVLGQYDIIFAQGRSALEAMAAGCSVMICSSRAFGPLITQANFDFLRNKNFGIRTLNLPLSSSSVIEELARYSSSDAQLVAQKTRDLCSIENTVDQLLELYQTVIQEQELSSKSTNSEENISAALYLQEISHEYKSKAATNELHVRSNHVQTPDSQIMQTADKEKANLQLHNENLSRQLDELSTTHQNHEERHKLMVGSATWRTRNFLLEYRGIQWVRHALRLARGLS